MDFDAFCTLVLFRSEDEVRAAIAAAPELLSAADDYGFTALHILMTEERPHIVELLISSGADVHARNKSGNRPLHIAQDPDAVTLLFEAGADIGALNLSGQTPLIVQAAEGYDTGSLKTMERLVQLGADVSISDNQGLSAMDVAKRRGELKKVRLLERATRK